MKISPAIAEPRSSHAPPPAPLGDGRCACVCVSTAGMPSPVAQLGGSPRRRHYAGRDLERARSIEDLRAMAHTRLPRFVLEYLEGGAEDEASLARDRAAYAQW